ncbi:MAG: enoyl-CoA hydratase/isomerase family protein [Gammaproteobacteria bacterium]|nr:enoyl-CoA hydratase/isomerase family protein [Gammaproteobacteria bacterium]
MSGDRQAGVPSYRHIALAREGAIGLLELARPAALNALTRELRLELHDALDRLAGDAGIRAVVFSGQGRAFCAGADLKEAGSSDVELELLEEYLPCFTAIAGMDKPVIAAVTGAASGVGLSLALHCDLLVMAEDAFLGLAFARIGLVPDGGASWLLVRQLGYRRAFELALEAGRIPASRALELGLANRVVPEPQVVAEARQWATQLAGLPVLAVAGTKKLMRLAAEAGFDEVFREEALLQARCGASEYFRRCLEEFRHKRPAGSGASPG